MSSPNLAPDLIHRYLRVFRSVLNRSGDEKLRSTLSAAREVTRKDRQMTQGQKDYDLALLDRVEAELLPRPNPR
jgi:hypothetical protein